MLIGDCHTAALIASDGSIDWHCPGRFDAPAAFCRILDADRGGYFETRPLSDFTSTRRYVPGTNVLETTLEAAGGGVRLTDFMPVHRRLPARSRAGYDVGTPQRIMRLVEGLTGQVQMILNLKPTFDYARAPADWSIHPGQGLVSEGAGQFLALASRGLEPHVGSDGTATAELTVSAGDRHWLSLTYADSPDRAREALTLVDEDEALARTLGYWEQWVDACTYHGRYRDQVLRSALALKLLDYEPNGAVIAAPTTSLPEAIGGVRNWDYRFSWLRDSTLIVYALDTIGYQEEAGDFLEWLGEICGGKRGHQPQIMYGPDGRQNLTERTLDHLDGYRGSRPVRIGNAAYDQHQLDIYGEVLRAAYVHYAPGGPESRRGDHSLPGPTARIWTLLSSLVTLAAEQWEQPDRGIWEVRGGTRHFLHSKLMCWAALDRGIRLAESLPLGAPLREWRKARDIIRQAIEERGFNPKLAAFTQTLDGDALDASALEIPLIGFLPPADPRVHSTIDAIQKGLTHSGLVYRYLNPDGLPGGEATFALCSFWLVDALAVSGRVDEARAVFEHVTSYANDVGLLAEEIDPSTGELLGNFPQGFSHMALIGSAVNLAEAEQHGAEADAENESQRAERARSAAANG